MKINYLLLLLLSILLSNAFGISIYTPNESKEYLLMTLDEDPMPKKLPAEFLNSFLASTSYLASISSFNNRQRLIDQWKKKKLNLDQELIFKNNMILIE
jgi:hypothetical protein